MTRWSRRMCPTFGTSIPEAGTILECGRPTCITSSRYCSVDGGSHWWIESLCRAVKASAQQSVLHYQHWLFTAYTYGLPERLYLEPSRIQTQAPIQLHT